jgi:plastocyanin
MSKMSKEAKRRRAQERRRRQQRVRAAVWTGTLAILVGGLIVVAVLAIGGNGSDDNGTVVPVATPDPRVAGMTPAATHRVLAGDAGQAMGEYFEPDVLRARAGEPFEIIMENVGSVAHNLRVSGPDGVYHTDDDFVTTPYSIQPGEEGRLMVIIEEPGSYPFQCDFHPVNQVGTLIVE